MTTAIRIFFALLISSTFILSVAEAKRAAGPTIKALTKDGYEYSYTAEPMNTGCGKMLKNCGARVFLVAKNKDKKQAWKTELYNYRYKAGLETDAQEVRPTSLKFKGNDKVELTDERERHYIVKINNGSLYWPAKPRIYHAPR